MPNRSYRVPRFPGHNLVALLCLVAATLACSSDKDFPEVQNALFLACLNGDVKAAEASVHSGADVNQIDSFGGTPLQAAARSGHAEVVTLLVKSGARVDDNPGLVVGRTPLIEAAMKNHFDAVVALIEGGADVNKKNTNGRTPLDAAALALDDPRIAEFLIKHGAQFSRPEDNEALKNVGNDVRQLRQWPGDSRNNSAIAVP